jgi:hypothetical protein
MGEPPVQPLEEIAKLLSDPDKQKGGVNGEFILSLHAGR